MTRLKSDRGSVLIIVAILIAVLLGFAAFAVDVGHLMVVKNELHNAADATALSAANHLFPPRGPAVSSPTPPQPDWQAAQSEALNMIQQNKSDKTSLQQVTVECGYWNLTHNPPGIQPTTITPGPNDAPAVRVTVSKSPGNNGGPVNMVFGSFVGKRTADVAAVATAVCYSPGTVKPESLAPVAIPKSVADQYQKYNSPSSPINIGTPYLYPNSLAGQWTSFQMDANDVTTVRGLIQDGNPNQVSIGDQIWIEPGVKDSLYTGGGNNPSIQQNYAGQDIWLPVVDTVLLDSTHTQAPVVGFILFHVISAQGGSAKIITGYFDSGMYSGGGPIGPNWGPLDKVRLAE